MKLQNLRTWINQVVPLKVKHLLVTAAAVVFTIVGFQVQTSAISDQRVKDVEDNAVQTCVTRVETRETLRTLLSAVYTDVLYILPESDQAQAFAERGLSRIDSLYPELDKADC